MSSLFDSVVYAQVKLKPIATFFVSFRVKINLSRFKINISQIFIFLRPK